MANNLAIALTIGASVGGALAGIRSLQNSLSVFRNQALSASQRMSGLFKQAGAGMATVGAGAMALGGTVMAAAQPAIAFESAMADVRKVVDFDSPQGFERLSKEILALTRTLPLTAEELAAIAASGGQLGVAERDLAAFTATVAKMSVAFDMSAAESGDAMAKLANVYKIPIAEISRLGDAINELSNSSPAKAGDIVNTLGRIGGTAKQFGLSETAAAALSNSFISLGKSPEVAGTAINGMLTKLMTADKGGKEFQATLAQMGLNAADLKTAIARDANGALTMFLHKLAQLPKEQQMGALVDLFGREYADDVAVLAGNVDILEGSLKRLQTTGADGKADYLGSMDKEFAARAATTENNLQTLRNSLREIGITVGANLLPVINDLVNSLRPHLIQLAEWAAANPELIKQGLKVGAMLAAATAGFVMARSALSALLGVVTGARAAFAFLAAPVGRLGAVLLPALARALGVVGKGVLFVGRALLLNPIGLLVTAIATAALLIYRYWGPISDFFRGLWARVKAVFARFAAWVGGIWGAAVGAVQRAWSGLGGFFSSLWSGVKGTFATFAAWTGTIWGGAVSAVQRAWSGLHGFFAGLWAEVRTAFNGGIEGVSALILNWSPMGLFYRIFQPVMAWFGVELPQSFAGFGKMIIDGLVKGIQDAWALAKEKVAALGSGIKSWFAEKLGIHSPSRVFMGFGRNIVEGLTIGMDKLLPTAAAAAAGLSAAVAQPPPAWEVADSAHGGFAAPSARKNAAAFLREPAQGLGGDFAAAPSAAGITLHFAPVIHVEGNAANAGLREGMTRSLHEFERQLDRLLHERARRAY